MSEQPCPNANALCEELNKLRKDPQSYAEVVRKYLNYFEGNVLRIPGRKFGINTKEGKAGFREAADWLEKQQPVEPLTYTSMLSEIAEEFAQQMVDRDPSQAKEVDLPGIIAKRGDYGGQLQRTMGFGNETEEEVIVKFIVSDGDKNRGQRAPLFNTDVKKIGAAACLHNKYRTFCVIFTCTQLKDLNGEDV